MPINDPGNAGTASKTPARPVYASSQALTDARRARANALVLGLLTGGAILGGGLGTVLTGDPAAIVVAVIALPGLLIMCSAINYHRFPPAPRRSK